MNIYSIYIYFAFCFRIGRTYHLQLSHHFMALSVSFSIVLLLDTTIKRDITAFRMTYSTVMTQNMMIQALKFSPSFWFCHWSSSLLLLQLPVTAVNLGVLVVVVIMKHKW